MAIQRSQIRLSAVTGSLVDISNVANTALSAQSRLEAVPADQIQIDTLDGILGQVGAAIKRIQGDSSKDFTEVSAGVFTHELSRFTGDVALTGSVLISGADAEVIDKVSGGSLKLRAGALTGSVGKVSIELSGSEVIFRDGFTEAGGWSDDLSLAQSATDWQRFKAVFGEVSILSAISTAAALPTDSKFLYKVTSQTDSITGGQLRQVDGTHFSGSFISVPTGSRNENVDLFLNGQLLVSKSYDAVDYDYDIAGDGSTITFNFQLQPDDFLTAYAPISVASVAAYIGSNGTGGGGAPGGGGGAGNGYYDIAGSVAGLPAASEILLRAPLAHGASFTGGYAYCEVAPTSQVVLTVAKGTNSAGSVSYSSIGTITFEAAATVGTVSITGGTVSFSAGDILRIVAPGSQDATFASPSFALIGSEA
jgi:hypothetical protein